MTRSGETVCELDRVSLAYGRRRSQEGAYAVRDATLKIKSGKILGLVGCNGAGKTSLLELCAGAIAPTAGSIQWLGKSECDQSVRRSIGFATDVPAVPMRLTGRELLNGLAAIDGMTPRETRSRISLLDERLCLGDALDTRLELLSRGNQQRIGICQALLAKRELVLLDESFGPLDPVAQVNLRELLRNIAQEGTAIIVSSHQLDQLGKISDEIAFMHSGEITRHIPIGDKGLGQALQLRLEDPQGQFALLRGLYPQAWRRGPVAFVPWSDGAAFDEIAFCRSLPLPLHSMTVIGVAEMSLEELFLESTLGQYID